MHNRGERGERGVVAIVVALSAAVLLAAAALAVDLGDARQQKDRAEGAADAAALAGAIGLAGGPSQAAADAIDYAYRNVSSAGGGTPAACSDGVGTMCASSTDRNMSVEVVTPYTAKALDPASGTAYDDAQLVHVKICWDVAAKFARILQHNEMRVCGSATARAIPTPPKTTAATEAFDPWAPCSEDNFEPGGYEPTDGKVKEKTTVVATYGDESDLDPSSVQVLFDDAAVPANDVTVKKLAAKGANTFRYEISYKVPDRLADGKHSVGIIARDLDQDGGPLGDCGKRVWSFVKGKLSLAAIQAAMGCQENTFLNSMFPDPATPVKPGDLVGAVFMDETPLNLNPPFDPIFVIDDPSHSSANNVAYTLETLPNGHGEHKYQTRISYRLPSTLVNGAHTVYLKAFDSDQNKAGGDCGEATWTINYTGGKSTANAGVGRVELIE